MRKIYSVVGVASIALVLAGCSTGGSGTGSESSGGDDPIIIGQAGDFSSDYAYYDGGERTGAQVAVDELNEAGGIAGRPVELMSIDTAGDQTETLRATEEIIDAGASYLIGTTTPIFEAQAATACAAGVPISTGDLTAPTVTSAGDCVFQIVMQDNVQASVIAEAALADGDTTAFVLASSDHPYTEGLPLYFSDAFEHGGGTIVGEAQYKIDAGDFNVQVSQIASLDEQPDIIYTPMFGADMPTFLRQLRAAGVETQVMTGDGSSDASILEVGDAAEGMIGTAHAWPADGNATEEWYTHYEELTGAEPESIVVGLGYDEVMLVAQIIEAADGDSSPETVMAGLSTAEFEGVTGSWTMDADTRRAAKIVTMIEVTDGEIINLGTSYPEYVAPVIGE